MSKETMQWLNTQTLIGFTDKRGNAWHYVEAEQGAEPNHYAGAIPVADVTRRLFDWQAVCTPLRDIPVLTEDGVLLCGNEGLQMVAHGKTGHVFKVFSESYAVHQFQDWLIGNVSTILGDTLAIGSAGLLKGGAVAWVSVEVPDSIRTPEGVVFRPNLLACTSHDGSLATTYKRVVTNVVCDNTMAAGLSESGQVFKLKHTRYSGNKINEAREALAIVHTIAEDFQEEVKALCETTVTDRQWFAFLDAYAPIPAEQGRGRTQALNRQDELRTLWNRDPRVEPWKGTAYGVLQAVNTHVHHVQTVRGAERQERNLLRAVSGGVDKLDASTVAMLDKILANA